MFRLCTGEERDEYDTVPAASGQTSELDEDPAGGVRDPGGQ